MKNQKQPAFPTKNQTTYSHGLTKLEYISIMCLQGILSKDLGNYTLEEKVFVSIGCAKELLKQLENESI